MNPVIREMCQAFEIDHSIVPMEDLHIEQGHGNNVMTAPRWDTWLWLSRWKPFMYRWGHLWPGAIPNGIRQMRAAILKRFLASQPRTCQSDGHWLLLRRSQEHEYYRPGGKAEAAGYGVSRRAITNFDALAEELLGAGLKVKGYEPGAHDLAHQIRTFHGAQGIIGIRGAEFANVLWMRPGMKALMLATPDQQRTPTAVLAQVLGVRFAAIPTQSTHPAIAASGLLPILRSM